MFNTDNFAWKDVSILILGRTLRDVQGIKYKVSSEKEFLFGRGKTPLSIQSGNQTVEGTLMLLQAELERLIFAIKAVNPTSKITDVSFDVVVTYGDGNTAITDIVKGVQITEYEKGMEQNDKSMKVDLPFLALDVVEQA